MDRRNKNRGYKKLRVWNEAVEFYKQNCEVFSKFPFELKRVSSQQISSCDSIHRNIAEGYCRRSIREYIQFLYIAMGSLGESVSGLHACHKAGQISEESYNLLDTSTYKLENGMLKLIQSLEYKKDSGDWNDHLIVKESNETYSAG